MPDRPYLELNYRHLHGSGHAGIFGDDMTGRTPQDEVLLDGVYPNLVTVLLQLPSLLRRRAEFLPKVEFEYVNQDWRITSPRTES